MSAGAIWGRNRIYFYLSFFSAGSQGIITQLFVRRHYAENKELLLALILAAGALSYIAGIWLSGKRLGSSLDIAKAMLLLNLAGFISLLVVTSLVPYLISYCLACFSCNFAYNYLDHRYVHCNGAEELGTHVKSLLIYQMLAYVLSPLFFAVADRGGLPTQVIVAAIALVFCSPVLLSPSSAATSAPSQPAETMDEKREPLPRIAFSAGERLSLLYVLLFLSIVTIAISMMTYLLSEFYRFTDYAVKAAIVLTAMSISSAAAVLLLRPPARGDIPAQERDAVGAERLHFRPTLQAAVVLATLAMVALLSARLSREFAYVLVVCSVMGFAYGLFLNSTRRFAGTVSRQGGKKRYLTRYNNLQGFSSLMGYSLTVLIWFLSARRGADFYPIIMGGIILILALELALIFAWNFASRRRERRAELDYPARSE